MPGARFADPSISRLAAVVLLVLGCRSAAPAVSQAPLAPSAPPVSDVSVPSPESPQLAWWRDSMATRDARLGWWREARFGMFVHWGVYSALGGIWQGQPVKGYAEHIQRIRKISRADYLGQVAGKFDPVHFDADTWIRAAQRAGMGYFVITAKHHDGFAMFDSAISDYNVVKATPWHRDPMRALADAAHKHGMKFGFYYSHAFDWGEKVGVGNDWEFANPGGDRNLGGGRDWWLTAPQFLPQARRYVDEKAIPQLRELIAKYDPDILWFDTPHKLPPQEDLRILQAVRAAKPDLVVNGRIVPAYPGAPHGRFGDYASTADRPAEFPPQQGDWEAIPTTNESYGWHQSDKSHKSPGFFIALLAKAAARGGNVLLNIGPRGDGAFDPPDVAILDGLARWMEANRESIAGTTRTPLPVQAWGESTLRGNTLYLHVLHWPRGGRLTVGGLRSPVARAFLLADPRRAPLEAHAAGLDDVELSVPRQAPDPADSVVVLELAAAPVVDSARLLSTEVAADELRAFDGQTSPGLRFGAGKERDAWVNGWTRITQTVRWPVRLRSRGRFAVAIHYDADPSSAQGRFEVAFGDQRLAGTVAATGDKPITGPGLPLGEVTLEAGRFVIDVRGTEVRGDELFRLRSITLTPLPPG